MRIHRWYRAISLSAFLCALAGPLSITTAQVDNAQIQPAAGTLPDRVTARIEEIAAEQQLVGISVGIIRDGKVAFTRSFGHENLRKGIEAGDETMYRWASISKPLTAIVAVRLAQEGKLDLDADVRTYVPEFPDKGVVITARQLLCHQGGIVHYSNGPVVRTQREYESEHPFEDVVVALDRFKESPLVNEPGEKYSYTTHGYMLLGAVVQRAGGMKYADLVDEMIATPAGMGSLRPDYQWEHIPNRAIGYRLRGIGSSKQNMSSTDTDVSWKLPGGGFISTIGDLTRFGVALMGEDLLDDELKAQMWTRQRTRDGEQTRYGLGFVTNGMDGPALRVSHSGSQEKTKTYLVIAPGPGAGIALMCNTEHARLGDLANELLEMVIEGD